jgi:predicted Zn-dependent peptidase
MHRFIPVPLILAGLAGPVAAQPPGVTKGVTVEGITQYALPNGLQILLLPDPSQPKVTVNLTVFVGSRHEGYGETGMAHLLEHMVFKGCPKFPDVPKALRDHGANFNGTTWLDRTNYYETMPATDENLRFGIELEADRMANSFIKREELMKEFTVVRNEFEQGENSPEAMLSQRMTATAFEWHNYGKSTIGNKTDIERVPIDNLQAFYKKYYRPDNALLIVAGKFDEAKALEYAAKYFGPIKNPGDPVPQTYTEEPPQDGERLVTLRRVGTVGAVGVVYHTPAGPGPEFAACEVLESCLTDEPAGRLYKALVEPKLATSLSGSINPTHDPGVIEIVAQTEPAKTEEARRVMVETLENLSKQPDHPGGGRAGQAAAPPAAGADAGQQPVVRRGLKRLGRGRRLAAVLPAPRPARKGDGRRRERGRRQVPRPVEPDRGGVQPDRDAGAGRGGGRPGARQVARRLQGPGRDDRRRGVRPDPGERRGPGQARQAGVRRRVRPAGEEDPGGDGQPRVEPAVRVGPSRSRGRCRPASSSGRC